MEAYQRAADFPTNDADPELKEIFCEALQAEVERTSTQDLLNVMGDLNTMIGSDHTSKRLREKHGYGRMNGNGERLVDFCGINNSHRRPFCSLTRTD